MNDWATLVRQYLTRPENYFLTQAIALVKQEADACANPHEEEILRKLAILLEASREQDWQTVLSLSQELEETFRQTGQEEWALTVRLLGLDPFVLLVESYNFYPAAQQDAVLEKSVAACAKGVEISNALRDDSCIASYLSSLGRGLFYQGQLEAARVRHKKALEIYQRLAEARPDVYLCDVAEMLNDFGLVLKELGEIDAAQERYEEALEIYRQLAKLRPDIYLPKVATTLNNLGPVLGQLRQFGAAKASFEEALQIRRQLAKPPNVASTLTGLGTALRLLRQLDAAKTNLEEALGIYRQLTEVQPNVYFPHMGRTLSSLADVLGQLQQFDAAKARYEKALRIYQRLAEARPHVYLPDVARTLNNLGETLRDFRQFELAKERLENALEIRRQLAEAQPNVYLPDVARTLNNLGKVLFQLRQFQAAKARYEEVIALYNKLPLSDIDKTAPLYNLALLEEETLGKGAEAAIQLYEQAIQSCEEGLSRLSELEWQHRDVFKGDIEYAYLALIEHSARRGGEEQFKKLFGLMESLRNVESLANFGMPERSSLGIAAAPTQEMRRLEAKREAALARGEEPAQIDAEIQSLGRNAARARENRLDEVLERAQDILAEHRCAFLAVQATREGEVVFLSITPEGHRVNVADKSFLDELDALLVEIENGIRQLAERTRAPAAVVRDLWRAGQRVPRKSEAAFSKLPSAVQELLKDMRYKSLNYFESVFLIFSFCSSIGIPKTPVKDIEQFINDVN